MEEIIEKIKTVEKKGHGKPLLIATGILLLFYAIYKFSKSKNTTVPSMGAVDAVTGNTTFANGYILTTDGVLRDNTGASVQSEVYSFNSDTGDIAFANGYILTSDNVLKTAVGKIISNWVKSYEPSTNDITYIDDYTLDPYTGILTDSTGATIANSVKSVDADGITYNNGYTLKTNGKLLDASGNLITSNVTSYSINNGQHTYILPNVGNFSVGAVITYSDKTTLSIIQTNNDVGIGFITDSKGVVKATCGATNYTPAGNVITFFNGYTLSSSNLLTDDKENKLGPTNINGFYNPGGYLITIYNNGYVLNGQNNNLYALDGSLVSPDVQSYNYDLSITYPDGLILDKNGNLTNPNPPSSVISSNTKAIVIATKVKYYSPAEDTAHGIYSCIVFKSGYSLSTNQSTYLPQAVAPIILNGTIYFINYDGPYINANGTARKVADGVFGPIRYIGVTATFQTSAITPMWIDVTTGELYLYIATPGPHFTDPFGIQFYGSGAAKIGYGASVYNL